MLKTLLSLFNINRNGRRKVYSLHSKGRREPPPRKKTDGTFVLPFPHSLIVRCSFAQSIELIHPEQPGVKKADIKAAMAKKFKAAEDRIAVFGVRTKYGGGRSSGFVTVYDDVDVRKKYDTKTNLFKVSEKTGSTPRMRVSLALTARQRVTVRMARLSLLF